MLTTTRRPNAALAYRVLDHIDAHPEQWDQDTYYAPSSCGTTACFAGWSVLLSEIPIDRNGDVLLADLEPEVAEAVGALSHRDYMGPEYRHLAEVPEVAQVLLGINRGQKICLFYADQDRSSFGEAVEDIFGPRPLPTPSMAKRLTAQDITNTLGGRL